MQFVLATNNETIEAIKIVLSGLAFFVSLGTFIYLILSTRRSSITETITKERVDWIRQARKALLDFAQNYRNEDKNGMKEAKACLEMLMRRDTPEYRLVLEHLDSCLSDTGYDEDNYRKLLGLSSYILARSWQRIKLDCSKIWINNERKNDIVTYQVYPMIERILAGTYTEKDPDTSYYIVNDRGKAPSFWFRKVGNLIITSLCPQRIEKVILKHPAVRHCFIEKTGFHRKIAHVFFHADYTGSAEKVRIELYELCYQYFYKGMIPMIITPFTSSISDKSNTMPENKPLTGYPSIDKPWLKYYKPDANEKALNTPKNQSIYRFYKEKVFTKPDYPILKYFNATITTKRFLEMIDIWAKAFCAVGIVQNDMVPIYGTWCPEIAAIFFALNAIGAHPYFEKLDITEEALRTETVGAKVGVVFEPLWNETAQAVFGEERFNTVFMIGLADSMHFPLNLLKMPDNKAFRDCAKNRNKYIFKSQVKKLASKCKDFVEAPFASDRIAIITTSSGTTSSTVKGIMDTNESALANILGTAYSEPGFFAGKECLVTLPPTASTAINCFFLLPLYMGMTVRIDPRADEKNWTDLLLKYKPSVSINTGSLWYSFYRRVAAMRKRGRNIDLSFADTFIMGGSGVTSEQLSFMNKTAKECNAPHPIVSGYGCSEFFGVITVDKYEVTYNPESETVIDVGIPIPGATLGIFDDDGNELPLGKRGEIRVKGPSTMHGYYGKPELSEQVFDGEWLKTGDIGKMDANGYVYCYGRKKSAVVIGGNKVFFFDIANALRKEFDLEDCMVEEKMLINGKQSIVIYYVQKEDKHKDERDICSAMNSFVNKQGLVVDGYLEFNEAFPISPTTLKPKTRYTDGFFNYSPTGERILLSYSSTMEDDIWEKHIEHPLGAD